MKIVFIVLIALVPSISFGQDSQTIEELLSITKNGLTESQPVEFDRQANALIVGDLVIPVKSTTVVKATRKRGNNSVEFSLQNYTSITSKNDPAVKKAWYELQFKSKTAARSFVKAFQDAIEP